LPGIDASKISEVHSVRAETTLKAAMSQSTVEDILPAADWTEVLLLTNILSRNKSADISSILKVTCYGDQVLRMECRDIGSNKTVTQAGRNIGQSRDQTRIQLLL